MAAARLSGRQEIFEAEAATMGGSGGETLRQVSVEGQGLAHTVSGMSAEGVRLVPLLSQVGGRCWGFPHQHGSQLVLGVRRPKEGVFHCRG